MKLIVGLGNPGSRYQGTRHNVGYAVCDSLADKFGKKFRRSLTAKCKQVRFSCYGKQLLCAKPLTFMNLSGSAVKRLVKRYSIDPARDLLIVVDCADLPLGRLRFREKGSSGGHRGLTSVIDALRTSNFARLRVGIGRPECKEASLADYVLEPFSQDEKLVAYELIKRAQEATLKWVKEGPGGVTRDFSS